LWSVAMAIGENVDSGDTAQEEGMKIVRQALGAPLAQILINAGIDSWPRKGMGIDVERGIEADMAEAGIIETVGGLRVALRHATAMVARFLMIA
jgi:chaperonin GroEL (HSP60 family)